MTETITKYGKIPFLKWRKVAVTASIVLILGSLGSLFTKGLNLGIDFTGGTLVELGYPDDIEPSVLRTSFDNEGIVNYEVAYFGSNKEILIRVAPIDGFNNAQLSEKILELARNIDSNVDLRRVEFVGPKVGEELTTDGGLAMLYALFGILIYIAFRFEWRFAVGSVAALVHDVIITLGIFSFLGLSFDLTVLAAILAVIGYSLNDTIVVFDRIRENFINLRKGTPDEITNKSLNDMLARTLMTSLTTLLVLFALFFLGGEVIHQFASALIIGVFVGTYSSIYIASSSAIALGVSKEHLIPAVKEGDSDKDHSSIINEQLQRKKRRR